MGFDEPQQPLPQFGQFAPAGVPEGLDLRFVEQRDVDGIPPVFRFAKRTVVSVFPFDEQFQFLLDVQRRHG